MKLFHIFMQIGMMQNYFVCPLQLISINSGGFILGLVVLYFLMYHTIISSDILWKLWKFFFIQVFFRYLSLLKLVVNIFLIQILTYTASVQKIYLKWQLNEILPVTGRLHSCVFLQFWWRSDLLYLVVQTYAETEYLWYNTVENGTLPWTPWKRRLKITLCFSTWYS